MSRSYLKGSCGKCKINSLLHQINNSIMSSGLGIRSNMLRVKFCPRVQKRPLNGGETERENGESNEVNLSHCDTGIKIEEWQVCLKVNNLYK